MDRQIYHRNIEVAPDYPGFGFSDVPSIKDFEYSFENIARYMDRFTEAVKLTSFTVYLHDYGSYIGARICLKNPDKISAIIVQNGNNYLEGHGPQWEETKAYWNNPTEEKKEKVYAFLSKEGTKEQYFAGVPEHLHQNISPESWIIDWERLSRPGNLDIQYKLNCTYPTNFELFPDFQAYLRKRQPTKNAILKLNAVLVVAYTKIKNSTNSSLNKIQANEDD